METRKPPLLQDGEPERVFFTHDESSFHANDGMGKLWAPVGDLPLRPKSRGRCIMVSAFVSPECGLLKLNEQEQNLNNALPEAECIPVDSTKIIHVGAKADGYWKNENMIAQVFQVHSS